MPDDEGMPIQIAKPELNMSKIGGPEAVDIHLSAGQAWMCIWNKTLWRGLSQPV